MKGQKRQGGGSEEESVTESDKGLQTGRWMERMDDVERRAIKEGMREGGVRRIKNQMK